MDINQLKNIICIGRVSTVNAETCTCTVAFTDKDNKVSRDLPVMQPGSKNNKVYWMPDIDSQVVCIFLPNPTGRGLGDGVVLGCIYSSADPPAEDSAGVKSIRFDDGSYIHFSDGTLEIHANKAIKLTAPRIDLN